MAKSTNLNFTQNAKHAVVQFAPADTTAIKDLMTAGADDAYIYAISVTSTDGAGNTLYLYVNDGTTDGPIGHVAVAANSGTDGTVAATNGLNATLLPWLNKDSNGNPFMKIPGGLKLRGSMKNAVATSKVVTVTLFSENY